jgi:hypothetical protein
MARTKPKATVMVGDGAGGMVKVEDRRFDRGDWPIRFDVPIEQADNWFRYVEFECERRGWSSAGMSQLEARANSGSLMLLAAGGEKLSITWDRARGGVLSMRARPAAGVDVAEAHEFFRQVKERSGAAAMEGLYVWGVLEYKGRAWCGELWLDDKLRLGPPSKQYEGAVCGPRAVVVDATRDCISRGHSAQVLGQLLEELAAFLSVMTGILFHLPQSRQAWTSETTAEGTACSVRFIGYVETAEHPEMPAPGTMPPVPLVPRGETIGQRAVRSITQREQAMPEDIVALWANYRALTPERKQQFLAAASKFQEALLHWGQRGTASFASMVVACEALKPADPLYSEHNMYDVIEALLGKPVAERLRTQLFDQKIHPRVHPQAIRSAHLHRGELYGFEFAHGIGMSNFRDPTFDAASRELFELTQGAITESLRRGGDFTMPPLKSKKSWRRWIRERALTILPLGTAAGLFWGWLLRALWSG